MTTLYVFRCGAAGHEIEEFFPIGHAPAQVECPDHGCAAVRLPSRGFFGTVPGGHDATYGGSR